MSLSVTIPQFVTRITSLGTTRFIFAKYCFGSRDGDHACSLFAILYEEQFENLALALFSKIKSSETMYHSAKLYHTVPTYI